MARTLKLGMLAVAVVLCITAMKQANADLITETSQAHFLTDLVGHAVHTETYESTLSGTTLGGSGTLNGITYTFNPMNIGDQLIIDSTATFGTASTSGTHFLGVDVPGNYNQITAGDLLSFTFASSTDIGMYFVTQDTLFAGDIQLTTSLGTALSSATPDEILAGGFNAYFLGEVSQGGGAFSSASIQYGPGAVGAFLFNIDDLSIAPAEVATDAVPEPTSIVMCVTGLACAIGIALFRSRRLKAA